MGLRAAAACTSVALELGVGAVAPTAGAGLYRNNILRAGRCATSHGVREADAAADPRVFESNDLDPTGPPTALYLDETATPLASAAAVDALLDMVVSGTFDADPLFVSYPTDLHLTAGSPCIGAGTAVGMPAADFDGTPRDPTAPDVGAYQH